MLHPFAEALGISLEAESYMEHAERLAQDFTLPDWPQGRINLVEAAVLDLFVRDPARDCGGSWGGVGSVERSAAQRSRRSGPATGRVYTVTTS
ncbi:MAG: hypothetical protein ACFHWZ_18025 [Phycisphaerales bacterium]